MYKNKVKNRVSEVIYVESEAKVDARCHTLKIDIGDLKCAKIGAKEKKKKKGKLEEIKLSNKIYGSYGDFSCSSRNKKSNSESFFFRCVFPAPNEAVFI